MGCRTLAWGHQRRPARSWNHALSGAGVRCRACSIAPPSNSRRRQQRATAGAPAHTLTAGLQRSRQSVVLRVASIDEEQYTEVEAREEFAASTRQESGRPEPPLGGSSSSNGTRQQPQQQSGTSGNGSGEPFRLDTGQLAKLNGLAADEVFSSGIISSAQARLCSTHKSPTQLQLLIDWLALDVIHNQSCFRIDSLRINV